LFSNPEFESSFDELDSIPDPQFRECLVVTLKNPIFSRSNLCHFRLSWVVSALRGSCFLIIPFYIEKRQSSHHPGLIDIGFENGLP
jgi:hypothetical protein